MFLLLLHSHPDKVRGKENLFKEQRLLGIRDLVERCIQRTGWANFCGKLDQTNSSEREKLKMDNSQMSSVNGNNGSRDIHNVYKIGFRILFIFREKR